MSEERTCNSEDTQPCSFKALFCSWQAASLANVLIHSTHDCWRAQRQNVLSSLWKVCSSLMTYVSTRIPQSKGKQRARRKFSVAKAMGLYLLESCKRRCDEWLPEMLRTECRVRKMAWNITLLCLHNSKLTPHLVRAYR